MTYPNTNLSTNASCIIYVGWLFFVDYYIGRCCNCDVHAENLLATHWEFLDRLNTMFPIHSVLHIFEQVSTFFLGRYCWKKCCREILCPSKCTLKEPQAEIRASEQNLTDFSRSLQKSTLMTWDVKSVVKPKLLLLLLLLLLLQSLYKHLKPDDDMRKWSFHGKVYRGSTIYGVSLSYILMMLSIHPGKCCFCLPIVTRHVIPW